jgi:DNA-directed RNA polymerase specialized sigma24 family protein
MSDTVPHIPVATPELKGLHERCARVAAGLFGHQRAADRAIEALFAEIPPLLKHPSHRATLEAWLLAELVFRARRHARAVATGQQLRRQRIAPPHEPLWWRLHERGELLPLVRQLPAVYAEAFILQYVEKVTLREMIRRTGSSAGVVTHRVTEAVARLEVLAAGWGSGPRLHGAPGEPRSHGGAMQEEPAQAPARDASRTGSAGSAQ